MTRIIGILLFVCFSVGAAVAELEKPTYTVISTDGKIEIREYQPMIIAEVNVVGDRRPAITYGFRLLANYIFGENTIPQITAQQEAIQTSQKIAMTAPVEIQANEQSWRISFLMPSEFTLDTLPIPKSEFIQLTELPAQNFITLRFSGRIAEDNLIRHENILREYIKANQIEVQGTPKFAFYNPPWTPPFLRRNEVMFELKDPN